MNPDQGGMDLERGADPVLTRRVTKLSEAAQTELRDNCQKQFAALELLQDEIMLFETDMSGETLPEAVNRLILTESELEMSINSVPKLPSKNPEVLLQVGKEEMQKQCSELEMVLSWEKAKRDKLLETLEWEQKLLEKKQEVYNVAVAHTERIRTENEPMSTKRHLLNIKDKIQKLSNFHEKLLEIMIDVVEKHFETPEDEQNLLPLEEILELLMNKAIKTTHDPYVTIDESFWPPYIEILLRYGIAVRHPEDNFKIRLESF